MAIPDYSNIKFDMKSMNTFFKDQGVNVAAGDTAKLNTIFKECDTEGAKMLRVKRWVMAFLMGKNVLLF